MSLDVKAGQEELGSFTCSRFTEESLKFNFWSLDPNHALFGVLCYA